MNTEHNQFQQEILIPMFSGIIDKPIFSALYDLEGKIILSTNLFANKWGYDNYSQICGKTLYEIYQLPEYFNLINDLDQIRQKVIQEQKTLSIISFVPQPDGLAMLLTYHFPLFNLQGEVVATRTISTQASIFNHAIKFTKNFKPPEKTYTKIYLDKKLVRLTKHEEKILYLLLIGLSQFEAGKYLNITRGTLSKILSQKICPQFGISGSNTKLLFKKVIASGYFSHIPKGLLTPKAIILDDDIELFMAN